MREETRDSPVIELLVLLVLAEAPRAEERVSLGLQIAGEARCPTVAQVTASLGHLRPNLTAEGWELELTTGPSAEDLRVLLYDPSRTLIGERRFTGLAGCDQRAEAVAATLAVWLGEVAAQPLPAPLYPETPTPGPAAENPQPAALNLTSTEVAAVRRRRWQLELGAAAVGAIDETGAGAAGTELSTWFRPVASRWGLQAHLAWDAPRSLPLGPGFADWQRVTLGAGAHFPLERGRQGFELEADLLGAVAVTHGRRLSVSRFDASLEPGLFVGTRFFVDPVPRWRGWLSVGLALWPVRQQVGLFSGTAPTPSAVATLPQLDLWLALGGSWLD